MSSINFNEGDFSLKLIDADTRDFLIHDYNCMTPNDWIDLRNHLKLRELIGTQLDLKCGMVILEHLSLSIAISLREMECI